MCIEFRDLLVLLTIFFNIFNSGSSEDCPKVGALTPAGLSCIVISVMEAAILAVLLHQFFSLRKKSGDGGPSVTADETTGEGLKNH